MGAIRTLHHQAENVPTRTEAKSEEHKHIKTALKSCRYTYWAHFKSTERSNIATTQEEERNKRHNVVIPYVAGVSENSEGFSLSIASQFTSDPANLRQKQVHPKDETLRHKLNNVYYAVQCSEECRDFYIGETKQSLHKCMAQQQRASSSGQDSAVHLHLKEKGHSFKDETVHVLDREDWLFEKRVKDIT